MSFWSSLGKIVGAAGSVAGPIASLANPLLGAGITAGSSYLGKLSTDYENKKAVQNANTANISENQKNRDFNAAEAAKQRQFEAQQAVLANKFASDEALSAFKRSSQFAFDMWNKENSYNSPSAQIARLREAGINPNLFGGDNTSGSVGSVSPVSASPSMSHGASASVGGSIPMQSTPFITNPALEMANVRLANANAEKAESEADRTKRLLPGEVKIQGRTYDLVGSEVDVNKAQVKNLEKIASKQDAEINLINENIGKIQHENSLIDKQGNLVQKEIDSFEKKLVSALNEAASRVKLNLANASEVASKIALNYANAQKARMEGQSYALDNYLDSCKLALYKNDSAWTYSILQNGIRLDAADRSARSKHESAKSEPDYKMYELMNSDVIAFLRALGSAINFNLGSNASVRP